MRKKLQKTIINPIRNLAMVALQPLEKTLTESNGEMESPVCLIIGPPRSGTTLLYAILASHANFSYMSNIAHRLYATPVAATKIGMHLIRCWQMQQCGSLESRFGHINGWGAPNEGGWIWNQWIPQDYYLDGLDIDNLPVEHIRSTITGISKVMQGPFLNKNVMHSVHMRVFDKIFPNCLFIHVYRDLDANVRSIIHAQNYPLFEDRVSKWWSVKPKEWEQFSNTDMSLRACAQVHYIQKNIDEDAEILGSNRIIRVSYEELCENTKEVLGNITTFLSERGVNLQIKPPNFVKLEVSKKRQFDAELERRIEENIASFKNSVDLPK